MKFMCSISNTLVFMGKDPKSLRGVTARKSLFAGAVVTSCRNFGAAAINLC